MISSLQFVASLRVALSRVVDSGNWPDAEQGDNKINISLSGVDIEIWNDAFIAKIPIAGGANTTIDLRNFTSLLFETGKSLDRAFLLGLVMTLASPTAPVASLVVTPGASNGFAWFFDTLTLGASQTVLFTCPDTETIGTVIDATHKTLKFANPGTDALVATVIIIGGIDA